MSILKIKIFDPMYCRIIGNHDKDKTMNYVWWFQILRAFSVFRQFIAFAIFPEAHTEILRARNELDLSLWVREDSIMQVKRLQKGISRLNRKVKALGRRNRELNERLK